jgi:hypothetical protein
MFRNTVVVVPYKLVGLFSLTLSSPRPAGRSVDLMWNVGSGSLPVVDERIDEAGLSSLPPATPSTLRPQPAPSRYPWSTRFRRCIRARHPGFVVSRSRDYLLVLGTDREVLPSLTRTQVRAGCPSCAEAKWKRRLQIRRYTRPSSITHTRRGDVLSVVASTLTI